MGDEPWWVLAIEAALIGASVLAWTLLLVGRRPGDPLLPFSPRRPVPWGALGGTFWAGFLLVMILVQNAASAPLADDPASQPTAISTDEYAGAVAINSIGLVLTLALTASLLTALTGATPRDFGLPRSLSQAIGDTLLGLRAALLSIAPTLLVQLVLVSLFETPSQNPLLRQIAEEPSLTLFLSAMLTAVLVGPLFEEFVFRLLLQGWLEKQEAAIHTTLLDQSGDTKAPPDEPTDQTYRQSPSPIDNDPDNPYAAPASAEPSLIVEADSGVAIAGLARGWWSMLLSALAFAMVHFGNGPDPVALFVFGLILGYLYQRTHRLLPCVVCHMAFNTVMLCIAWAAASAG